MMLPNIHVKNTYKKFNLKDMQMISEDAFKSLVFHWLLQYISNQRPVLQSNSSWS